MELADNLERHYTDVQDVEFTIENARLFLLQTRSAKRTALSAVKTAVDMVHEGLITQANPYSGWTQKRFPTCWCPNSPTRFRMRFWRT